MPSSYPPQHHNMSSRRSRSSREYTAEPKSEVPHGNGHHHHHMHLPRFNHNGHEVTPGIEPEGESGRKGFHPLKFLKIVFKSNSLISSWVNILWPMVPVAIALVCSCFRDQRIRTGTDTLPTALCPSKFSWISPGHFRHQFHCNGPRCQ